VAATEAGQRVLVRDRRRRRSGHDGRDLPIGNGDPPAAGVHDLLLVGLEDGLEHGNPSPGPDRPRPDRDLPERHRPQDVDGYPGQALALVRLVELQRSRCERGRRAAMLGLRAPRPGGGGRCHEGAGSGRLEEDTVHGLDATGRYVRGQVPVAPPERPTALRRLGRSGDKAGSRNALTAAARQRVLEAVRRHRGDQRAARSASGQ
jgi:hypothetical protein